MGYKKCMKCALHSLTLNLQYKVWIIIMLIKPGSLFGHLILYLWLAIECVRAVCTCHSLQSVCVLVCALFWLQGCWGCPIMSSIISPVNMAKSSCPWEKLWKGECQYWQTNKFWQRGATFGQSVKATDMSLWAWAVKPMPDETWCVFFKPPRRDILWCLYNRNKYLKTHNFKISYNLPDDLIHK